MNSAAAEWLVVIGYGNDLRSDDGAGPQVARTVEALSLPGVRAIAVQQLTPELADEIASARLVLFVDASASPTPPDGGSSPGLQVSLLTPEESATRLGHFATPSWLLALTRQLHGQAPPARLLTIPAQTFDFGEQLSPVCQHAVLEAVRYITLLLARDT